MALTKTPIAMLDATGTAGSGNFLRGDGTWSTPASGITAMTVVASTSGTSIDFTSIPAGVKRITVMLNGVSTNGTANVQLQVGSGSFSTTGYSAGVSYSGAVSQYIASTTGFYLDVANTASASNNRSGIITLCLIGSNTWCAFGGTNGTWAQVTTALAGNSPALSGALDRIRITTSNGTDTFDAGSINVFYE